MSLWTPSGEHPINEPGQSSSPGDSPPPPAGGGDAGAPGPQAEIQMDELRRQLAEAPADVVVANHCYGLFELAAVYLSQEPPLFPQAQLAYVQLDAAEKAKAGAPGAPNGAAEPTA